MTAQDGEINSSDTPIQPRFRLLEAFVTSEPCTTAMLTHELSKITLPSYASNNIVTALRGQFKGSEVDWENIHWTADYKTMALTFEIYPADAQLNPKHQFSVTYSLVADMNALLPVMKIDASQNLGMSSIEKRAREMNPPGWMAPGEVGQNEQQHMAKYGIINTLINPKLHPMLINDADRYLKEAGWSGDAVTIVLLRHGVPVEIHNQFVFSAALIGTNVLKVIAHPPEHNSLKNIEIDYLLELKGERMEIAQMIQSPWHGHDVNWNRMSRYPDAKMRSPFSIPRLGMYEVERVVPDRIAITFHQYEEIEWMVERLLANGSKQAHELTALKAMIGVRIQEADHYVLVVEGAFIARNVPMNAVLKLFGYRKAEDSTFGHQAPTEVFHFNLVLSN